jgi:hypothetical protein
MRWVRISKGFCAEEERERREERESARVRMAVRNRGSSLLGGV